MHKFSSFSSKGEKVKKELIDQLVTKDFLEFNNLLSEYK